MNAALLKPVVAVALFLAVLAALGTRQYRNLLDPENPRASLEGTHWGMADFRDVIYYPTVAVLEGDNPYDSPAYMAEYPVGNVFPLYSPHLLLLFAPFGLLPFALSGILFWLLLVSTYPIFSALCLKVCEIRPLPHRVFFLATAILVSVPGRWAFDAGQLAVLWSIGTVVAIRHAARHPVTAGLGLMLAACKPTFGVPLALLLLFQRRFKPVILGSGFAALAGGITIVTIAVGPGWGAWLSTLDQNQSTQESVEAFDPTTSHTRVDANVFWLQVVGLPGGRWAELAVFGACILAAGLVLRGTSTAPVASPAGSLVLLTLTVCVYHQTYDTVLLTPIPLAVLAPTRRYWKDLARPTWIALALLCAVPLLNVTWSRVFQRFLEAGLHVPAGVREALFQVAAVTNSVACLLAFGLLVGSIGSIGSTHKSLPAWE